MTGPFETASAKGALDRRRIDEDVAPAQIALAMTLPLYLAVHLVYGAVMGRELLRRMRAEGEVLGVPLLVTLAPVCVASAPLGAVLVRYTGAWFLHGAFLGDEGIAYERFQLGLMVAIGLAAGLATVAGLFFSVAVLSRNQQRLASMPSVVAALVLVITLSLDGGDVVRIPGTGGRWIFLHPAGLVSLAIVAILVAVYLYARARTALVMPKPAGPTSVIPFVR